MNFRRHCRATHPSLGSLNLLLSLQITPRRRLYFLISFRELTSWSSWINVLDCIEERIKTKFYERPTLFGGTDSRDSPRISSGPIATSFSSSAIISLQHVWCDPPCANPKLQASHRMRSCQTRSTRIIHRWKARDISIWAALLNSRALKPNINLYTDLSRTKAGFIWCIALHLYWKGSRSFGYGIRFIN